MINVNETIIAYDLAEALASDSGIYEVKRGSQTFRLVSRAGHSITSFRAVQEGQQGQDPEPWRIKKVGELRSEQQVLQ